MSNKPKTIKSNFGKVAVLLGGLSAEREVSLASGKAILSALRSHGVDAWPFDPSEREFTELLSERFDRAFIALHGRGGEDGVIQGALEQIGIPYTGSGVAGSTLSIDKVLSKLIWHARGYPTAKYKVVHQDQYQASDCTEILKQLEQVVMVKPSHEGSSLGMAKASDPKELHHAIMKAFEYDAHVLVESFIHGPEYTVSILGDTALPSIRMISASGFYDYEAKYQVDTTQYFCPSGLSEAEESEIQKLALSAFKALQGKGWGRIDLMRGLDKQFYLLESNTVPGMTEKSLVPKAAEQAGIHFDELVLQILQQTSVPV